MTYDQLQDALAARMAQTASVERALALKRDGRGLKRPGPNASSGSKPVARRWSAAGLKARELALTTTLNGAQIAKASGLSPTRAKVIVSEARGTSGQNGGQRSPASIEAERLLRGGSTVSEARAATGLSKSRAHRLAAAIRSEGVSA